MLGSIVMLSMLCVVPAHRPTVQARVSSPIRRRSISLGLCWAPGDLGMLALRPEERSFALLFEM